MRWKERALYWFNVSLVGLGFVFVSSSWSTDIPSHSPVKDPDFER
jgi:hypothetical protein